MKDLDKTFLDIDELAKKIEQRIKELEEKENQKNKEKEYQNAELGNNIANLDEIIKEIDKKIAEIELEEKLDVQELTDKVNAKLAILNEFDDDDDLEKTRYDLEEISRQINETIKALEEKKKKEKTTKSQILWYGKA